MIGLDESVLFTLLCRKTALFLHLAARNDSITSSTNHALQSDAAPPVVLRADRVRHHRHGDLLQDVWHDGRGRICKQATQQHKREFKECKRTM